MSRGKVVWKLMAWPLCLAVLLGALCLPSPARAEGTATVDSWAALKAAVETGAATSIVVSGTNLMADKTIFVNQNRTVAISAAQGAGPITREEGFAGELFMVMRGGGLTLTNITLYGNGEKVQNTAPLISVYGKFTLGSGGKLCNNANSGFFDSGGAVYVNPQGSFTMTGGEISGNSAGLNGGAVSIGSGGSFTMTGGKIYGNTAGGHGGGVHVSDGEFIMTGGDIGGNRAYVGGGVYQFDGTFTLNGGRIQNNLAITGGGVQTDRGAFTMDKGEISGNSADDGGGGVCLVGSGCVFTMKGGTVRDNTASDSQGSGGGVLVSDARFNLEGGTISGNQTPNGFGAGVYVDYNASAFAVQGKPQLGLHDGDNGLYLLGNKTVSIGPSGLAEGGRINLEGAAGVTDARVVAVKEAGTATSQEAARFHYQPGGYAVHPEAAGSPNYVLRAPHTVTVRAGAHGSVTPAGDVQVPYGGSQSFTLSPESGYVVDKVLLDGKPVAHTGGGVTLSNVTASLTLHVTFARGIVVPANEAGAHKKEPAPKEPDGTAEPERRGWYLATTALNVRSGPGTSYPKLGKLAAGEWVEVLDVTDGWAKIAYAGGVDGYAYVPAQYLVSVSGGAQGDCTVLARTLNVRAGPGTGHAIVGQLRRAQTAQVLETVAGGGWLRIRFADGADGTAYISAKYAAH